MMAGHAPLVQAGVVPTEWVTDMVTLRLGRAHDNVRRPGRGGNNWPPPIFLGRTSDGPASTVDTVIDERH